MHPDLTLIVGLWTLDAAVDDAKGRAAALKQAVTDADVRITELTKELEGIANRVAEAVQEETAVNTELEKYVRRTQRTQALLDGHQAVDFVTVEKQLAQCKAHVGRLEDSLLEILDGIETLKAEASVLEQEREETREAKGELHARWVSEGREIRVELEELWPRRQAAAAELSRDMLVRYKGFRDRGLVPVAPLGGKVCTACNVVVQDQMRLEVASGRRIHNCRGCGRWLLPPVPEEVDPEAESE